MRLNEIFRAVYPERKGHPDTDINSGPGGGHMSKLDMERANRKRIARHQERTSDSREAEVMKHLTPKSKDARSKSNLRRGITGVSGKERLSNIKKAAPGEM